MWRLAVASNLTTDNSQFTQLGFQSRGLQAMCFCRPSRSWCGGPLTAPACPRSTLTITPDHQGDLESCPYASAISIRRRHLATSKRITNTQSCARHVPMADDCRYARLSTALSMQRADLSCVIRADPTNNAVSPVVETFHVLVYGYPGMESLTAVTHSVACLKFGKRGDLTRQSLGPEPRMLQLACAPLQTPALGLISRHEQSYWTPSGTRIRHPSYDKFLCTA